MNANISLVMHFLHIVSVFTLSFCVLCALITHPFLRWSNRFEPKSRLLLLRLFASWPLLSGLAIGVMVSLPSLSHVSKLPLDHCHNLGGCMMQPISHMLTTGELVMITVLLAILASATLNAFLQWHRLHLLTKQIDTASHTTLASGARLIETTLPMAFSLGIFKSIAVLSTGLVRVLTPQQLDIICIHEQTHVRHHDNEYKWALRLLCVFHLPHVKHALLSEHALAMEIRADQQVARHIQDPIAVAETIVAMQRLMKPLNINAPLCQFIGSALERRVQYLLAQSPGCGLPKYSVALCLLAVILAMTCGSIPLHNALEALIT